MKPKKVVYYNDPLNDDFAGTNIKKKPFPKNFKYLHRKNPFWTIASFLFYYFAMGILWIVGKVWMGVKVKGRKNMRTLFRRGAFVYGNHTQIVDAWTVQCYVLPVKRGYILADSDAISIPGIRPLVMMLGCLPIPDLAHKDAFVEAVNYRYHERRAIVIYPEKHIWPYSTHIRPYPDDSFVYPASLGAPVVAICTTYRPHHLFPKRRPPKMTIHVSKPMYPDMDKSLAERKKDLRDRVYDFMLDWSCEEENLEWVSYVQRKEGEGQKAEENQQ